MDVAPVSDTGSYTANQIHSHALDVQGVKMNKKVLGAVLGLAVLGVSTAASAHVDVAIGLGVPLLVPAQPVYEAPPPPPPVVVAQAPVVVGYGYGDGPDWRERRAWREREWHRREWREREWREHHDWH
jgi:hypothetical protein